MPTPTHVDLFIPQWFFDHVPCYFFGIYRIENDSYQAALICLSHDGSLKSDLTKFKEVASKKNLAMCYGSFGNKVAYSSNTLTFCINWDEHGKLFVPRFKPPKGKISQPSITLLLYDSHTIFGRELLLTVNNTFVDFLNVTHQSLSCELQKKLDQTKNSIKLSTYQTKFCMNVTFLCNFLQFIFFPFHYSCKNIRLPKTLLKLVNISATGRQVCHNIRKYNEIYGLLENGKIGLLCGNLLVALAFDILSGLYLSWAFRQYLETNEIVENMLDWTDMLVNSLQELLHWLMGVPAGLKLNRPLNTVCGRFFLYHIYLWKTYIVVLQPYLPVALNFSLNFGIFGSTFLLSLISDFVSLATIHIYFFYSYAARLYDFKISSCICLWRLFRGKKWNPLRNRVDSYHYDVQQLFIGTLMFTIVIFLLPTVFVYYFVFTLLRLVILAFMTAMTKIIDTIATLPIYVIILQIFKHNSINGDIYFDILSNSGKTLTISMKGIPVSWNELLNRTLPKDTEMANLTMGVLLRSLIRGTIIYPW